MYCYIQLATFSRNGRHNSRMVVRWMDKEMCCGEGCGVVVQCRGVRCGGGVVMGSLCCGVVAGGGWGVAVLVVYWSGV